MITIKKYSNRRLYDTDESRYITLDELSDKLRAGAHVRVLDAKSGADLTHTTLVQIGVESRALVQRLPEPLLLQLLQRSDEELDALFARQSGEPTATPAAPQSNEAIATALGALQREIARLSALVEARLDAQPPTH